MGDAEGAKDPSCVRASPSVVRVNVTYITPGRATCRSGQGALHFQLDVVSHIHI